MSIMLILYANNIRSYIFKHQICNVHTTWCIKTPLKLGSTYQKKYTQWSTIICFTIYYVTIISYTMGKGHKIKRPTINFFFNHSLIFFSSNFLFDHSFVCFFHTFFLEFFNQVHIYHLIRVWSLPRKDVAYSGSTIISYLVKLYTYRIKNEEHFYFGK